MLVKVGARLPQKVKINVSFDNFFSESSFGPISIKNFHLPESAQCSKNGKNSAKRNCNTSYHLSQLHHILKSTHF